MPDGGLRTPERKPQAEAPEAALETVETRQAEARPSTAETQLPETRGLPEAPAYQSIAPPAQRTKDPVLKRVEEILEQGLVETYLALPPDLKQKFKTKGEETAGKIQQMIASAKLQAGKVVRLIVSWLRLIPQVNRFFLEQDAKIKTDRIIALAERERTKRVSP